MKEFALVIIKPDALKRGLMGPVLKRLENPSLTLVGIKLVKTDLAKARAHYQHLKDQPFFDDIVRYLAGEYHGVHSLLALVYYGDNAIQRCRKTAGATNPEEAAPYSLRGTYGRITTKGVFENIVHVSSTREEARREIRLWFSSQEVRAFAQHFSKHRTTERKA